jgi:hypothetical protein
MNNHLPPVLSYRASISSSSSISIEMVHNLCPFVQKKKKYSRLHCSFKHGAMLPPPNKKNQDNNILAVK